MSPTKGARRAPCLHPSRSSESDRHTAIVGDDDRDRAAALAERQHPVEVGVVLLDVDILERDLPPLVVVTGGLRVRSRILAEDVNHRFNCRIPDRCARTDGPIHTR